MFVSSLVNLFLTICSLVLFLGVSSLWRSMFGSIPYNGLTAISKWQSSRRQKSKLKTNNSAKTNFGSFLVSYIVVSANLSYKNISSVRRILR